MPVYFPLHYPNYLNERSFLHIIRNIDGNILRKNNLQVAETFLNDNNHSNNITKNSYFQCTIDFRIATKRFDVPYF